MDLFGHRGTNEMELAQPRWSESPQALDKLIRGVRTDTHPAAAGDAGKFADEAKLAAKVQRLRTYLGLREAGKHYLLMGYAVIRRALVELDRRFGLNGGIFFLTPADLPSLLAGDDLSARIATARKRRQTELSLEVPPVLFSDDLDAIGRSLPELPGGDKLDGVPLSAGVAEGPALVLTEPTGRAAGWRLRTGVPVYRSGVGAAVRSRESTGDGDGRRAVARGNRGARIRPARGRRPAGRDAAAQDGSNAPRRWRARNGNDCGRNSVSWLGHKREANPASLSWRFDHGSSST